jgi:hypothetical protein
MGAPTSLLGSARAFARDFARDKMPPGYLWDVVDFVPQTIDANLTNRGSWKWGSQPTGFGYPEAGILALFPGSDQILVQSIADAANGRLLKLNQDPAVDQSLWTWTDLGATHRSAQNPIQLDQTVIHCDAAGLVPPQLWREGGPVSAYAGMHRPRYATVWQGALISGGGHGVAVGTDESAVLRASITGLDLTTAASFDNKAFQVTSAPITGLKTLRSMVLIFHPSSIERLRGGPLWNTAGGKDGTGLVFDTLSEHVGCKDARSIASWTDYVIFADEHGVHMTDGATIKNITEQGGISYYWRLLYEGASSVCATRFLDYYIVTLRHPPLAPVVPFVDTHTEGEIDLLDTRPPVPDPPPPVPRPPVPPIPPDLPPVSPPLPVPAPDTYATTLICDLNRKKWFRFSNVNAITFFTGGGRTGMERVWAGFSGYDRLVRIGPTFYPDDGAPQKDADGWVVQPRIETPWYRLGEEGRKRARFGYLSYDCRTFDGKTRPIRIGYATSPQNDATYSTISVMPNTLGYTRHRFALNRAPYGIMFYVEACDEIGSMSIFDLAVEAWAEERSRV